MADRLLVQDPVQVVPSPDFDGLLRSEQKRIYLLCRRMLNDNDEADSATQDVFVKAWRAMHTAEPLENPGGWLTRIAVNTCLDRLRSRRLQFWRKRPAREKEEAILSFAAATEPGAARQLYAKQIQRRLELAMEKLSGQQRAVFALKHFDGNTIEEIAGIMQLDSGSVKSHMSRALAKMRIELRDLYFGNHEHALD